MNDIIRESFERASAPSFGHELTFPRDARGEYVNPALEDHWQTFQEGWEAAMEFLKTKQVSRYSDQYSDITSTGGKDPR